MIIKETDISPRLRQLLEGINLPGDCGNDVSVPDWYDANLFEKGRAFFNKYFFCIIFSQFLGLMTCYSVDELIVPLIYTQNSETPKKALKRYLSTVIHIVAWFEEDIWSADGKGRVDLLSIRKLHKNITHKMNNLPKDEVEKICIDTHKFDGPLRLTSVIRKDLVGQTQIINIYGGAGNTREFGSQFFMALTQYAFVGYIVAHPRTVGVWWASRDEIEGFLHYWRNIGWLLGIHDNYNLCSGSLEEVKDLCLEIESKIIIPHFAVVEEPFEHLAEALTRGLSYVIPAVSFPSMLIFIASALKLNVPRTRQHINWTNYWHYILMKFVFSVLFVIPAFISIFNGLLRLALGLCTGAPTPAWWPFQNKRSAEDKMPCKAILKQK